MFVSMSTCYRLFLFACFLSLGACGTVTKQMDAVQVDGETRLITDAFGKELTIPKHPQRVLALSEVDLDVMLALQHKPIGACAGRGQTTFPGYLLEHCADIELMGALYRPSIEKIILAKPDLILLGGWVDSGVEKQLQKIAPVLRTYTLEDNWKSALHVVANALQLEAQERAFLQKFEQNIKQLKQQLGDKAHATVSVVRWNPKGPAFMYADSFARQVMNDIGFQCPEQQREKGPGHSQIISFEQLSLIDADMVFIGALTAEGEAATALAAAEENPAFQQLAAAQANHVHVVDGSLWTSAGGALAALHILKDVGAAIEQPAER